MTTSQTKKSKQLTLFVTFYVQPHLISEWKTAHRPVWAALATEPRCLLFDVFSEPAHYAPSTSSSSTIAHKAGIRTEPSYVRFRLVEVWDADKEWFEREQLTKPYYEELWKGSRPTWAKEMEIEWFQREGEGCSWKKEYLNGGTEGT